MPGQLVAVFAQGDAGLRLRRSTASLCPDWCSRYNCSERSSTPNYGIDLRRNVNRFNSEQGTIFLVRQ
jgi:hypothetical protein